MTPELLAAYHKLYGTWWNKVATVEIDLQGYNGISHEDTLAMDEVAEAIESLIKGEA